VSEVQPATRFYLAALAVVTAAVTALALVRSSLPDRQDTLLALAFFGLQVLAVSFPLHIGPQQKLSLHTAVIIAAVLLFDPGTAVLIAGAGTVIGQSLHREPGVQILFNGCQTALQTGLAGLALSLFAQPPEVVGFTSGADVVGVLCAAVIIYLVDAGALSTIVRLETGRPIRSLLGEIIEDGLVGDLAQFALGLLTAVAVDAQVWTLPLVVLLAYQLHHAGKRLLAAQQHERELLAESERIAGARQEFLLTASHELKTPITAVRMAAQLLDRAVVQHDPAFRADQAAILRWRDQLIIGINRLEELVAELLDAARIQRGQLDLHPEQVDLAAIVRDVVERFELSGQRTTRHQIILDAPASLVGVWDPEGIDQVVTNLVSNALKYSPQGGRVSVRLEEFDDAARLTVSDTGIGIAPEFQTELFKPFERGSALDQGISGTGLGLYIIKRVVEQHGGTVALDSAPGAGTTVTIDLPCSPAAAEAVADNDLEPQLVTGDRSTDSSLDR
jgi:signal transduction histidine kinase